MSALKTLLTPRQLADYLGLEVQTIYNWKTTGDGPRRIKFRNTVRFDLDDVQAWINAHTEES
jgi:excisionase family DNA binding protein